MTLSSNNNELFHNIKDKFEKLLEDELKYLTFESRSTFSLAIISGWLADCNLEFY